MEEVETNSNTTNNNEEIQVNGDQIVPTSYGALLVP